jgi:hypothetical protein
MAFAGVLFLILGCESNGKNNNKQAFFTPSPEARKLDPVYAYVDSVRSDLSSGKVQIINQVMRLSPEESKVFWPIYHDYEEELFNLGDQRVELTRRFVTAQARSALDNQQASAIADGWFKYEADRLELLKKYHKRIAEELSPVRAAQFTQIEHRVGTVVDLVLASETPLVRDNAQRQR